jgi:polar amino acid transport system substrate-binding protein
VGYDSPVRALLPLLLAAAVAIAGCQYPRDVEGTLDRVDDGGTMRVGVSDNEPWVNLDGSEPSGVEPEIVRRFADSIGAKIQWVQGDSEELVGALEGGQLDVVIAGFTRTSEQRRKVALTRPYVDTELLLAHPRGESLPPESDEVKVAVQADSHAASLLEHKTEYGSEELDSLEGVSGPALVWDYWLDDLPGLDSSGQDLIDEEHAIAVRLGENAFLTTLEEFLLDREGEWRALVNREGKP